MRASREDDEALRARKRLLRAEGLAARRALTPEACAAKSAAIRKRLLALDEVRAAPTVLTYIASKDNEADTRGLVEDFLEDGKAVGAPVVRGGGEMGWSQVLGLDDLAPGGFGILEPRADRMRPICPDADSVALVPGIVFDASGHRIGYGGGYYDRFLASFAGIAVGLAFEAQMTPRLQLASRDVPVDIVVTERTVYRPERTGERGR